MRRNWVRCGKEATYGSTWYCRVEHYHQPVVDLCTSCSVGGSIERLEHRRQSAFRRRPDPFQRIDSTTPRRFVFQRFDKHRNNLLVNWPDLPEAQCGIVPDDILTIIFQLADQKGHCLLGDWPNATTSGKSPTHPRRRRLQT